MSSSRVALVIVTYGIHAIPHGDIASINEDLVPFLEIG